MIKVLEVLEKGKVSEYFGSDESKRPKVLARCFADTKEEVVKDAVVEGLPIGCVLAAGSKVIVSDGSRGFLKSDGTWGWENKADLITRTITENGTYEAADDNADGYVEVTVNVPDLTLVTKSVTANGTYDPAEDEADGYSEVTVNVPATEYEVSGGLYINEGTLQNDGTIFDKLNIHIPDTVTAIADNTFKNMWGISSVTMKNSVTTIGESSFEGCANLENVVLSNNITIIPQKAFYGVAFDCVDDFSIYIPEGVIKIGSEAFEWDQYLHTLVLPSTITEIGYKAFVGCEIESLTCKAIIPPSLDESFDSSSSACILYVPADSVSAYESAWGSYFADVQAIPTT